ncbi:hypothetical protein LMG22465_09160 [Lactobacillus helveticus]|nr:hypothetical protein LMG22465_09160 [Lactobacillus helveticus]
MSNLSNDLNSIINKRLNNLSASKIRAFDQKVSGIPGIIKLLKLPTYKSGLVP